MSVSREMAQKIADNLTTEDLITLGRIYQKLADYQSKSPTRTVIAIDGVRAVLPKVSTHEAYNKWVPVLKVRGMIHTTWNGAFNVL